MSTLQTILIVVVVLLMLGLGSTLELTQLKKHAQHPRPALIGLLSQFGIMPLIAFALASLLPVSDSVALSIIFIGCTPGGSTSNLFTYWSRGDLALSVVMTCFSSVLALGMMPLLLLIYSPRFTSNNADIDFVSIFLSLLITLVPVTIGMTVRYKRPKAAFYLEKLASIVGVLFILLAIIYGSISEASIFSASWGLWFAAVLMLLISASIGYGVSTIFGLEPRERRTVALETGIQNSTLTLTLIEFSYGDDAELRDEMIVFPLLYSLFLVIDALVLTVIFRRISRDEDEADKDKITLVDEIGPQDSADKAVTTVTTVHIQDGQIVHQDLKNHASVAPAVVQL
eukprot:TRINITY_DN12397_c1_g1_i1.p1 TRINITY_DN12397_c1_g1~~TRINITY_DN12397_c1_g1_i1.p1  ORF type:complete len:342 (+),score=32.16 TRINITY_DN12397_c1_g1_i1:1508-2533(+)